MANRLRVYIAGPYSKGDTGANMHKAMNVWDILWYEGYSPFCPHLSHFLHIHNPLPYEDWLEYDLDWLRVSDVVLRLDGASAGADKEIVEAKRLNIPVAHGLAALFREHPARKETGDE